MRSKKTYIFVSLGEDEIQRQAPKNFFKWSKKSRVKYIQKRWPEAISCCDGVPYDMGGISFSLTF